MKRRNDRAPVSPAIIASLVIFAGGLSAPRGYKQCLTTLRYVCVGSGQRRRSAAITAIKRADRKSFVRARWLGTAVTFQTRSSGAFADDEGAATNLRPPASFAAQPAETIQKLPVIAARSLFSANRQTDLRISHFYRVPDRLSTS